MLGNAHVVEFKLKPTQTYARGEKSVVRRGGKDKKQRFARHCSFLNCTPAD
jgi:hypothetical protein